MISVLMSAFNAEKTLSRAAESVLNSVGVDLELIIVDDGSTDDTFALLTALSQSDERVKVIKNDTNRGISYSLNAALAEAKGEYIARMDADDFCHDCRLKTELEYLNSHPEISYVGCGARLVDEDGRVWGTRVYPEIVLKRDLIRYNPYIHPTMLFRVGALRAVNGYSDNAHTVRCEDYDLAFRLFGAGYFGANVPKIMFDYYESRNSASRHNRTTRLNEHYVRRHGSKTVHGGLVGWIFSFKPLLLHLLETLNPKVYVKAHNKRWED